MGYVGGYQSLRHCVGSGCKLKELMKLNWEIKYGMKFSRNIKVTGGWYL